LVGLDDVIAEALGIFGRKTKAVLGEYQNLINKAKSEFNVLLDLTYNDLLKITLPEVVEGIRRNREGKVFIEPGYDGTYGVVKLFGEEERKKFKQTSLF
jgi:PHP family Zn ribbon phosphoesterase